MYRWIPANIFTARLELSALSFSSDVGMLSCKEDKPNVDDALYWTYNMFSGLLNTVHLLKILVVLQRSGTYWR